MNSTGAATSQVNEEPSGIAALAPRPDSLRHDLHIASFGSMLCTAIRQ